MNEKDDNGVVSNQQPGQAEGTSQPQTPPAGNEQQPQGVESSGQGAPQSQSLTEQQVLDIVNKAVQSSAEKTADITLRKFQSMTDKAEQRVKTEVANIKKTLEVAGLAPTAEQLKEIEGVTRARVKGDLEANPEPEQPQGEPVDPVVAEVRARTQKLNEQYKQEIAGADPESILVKWSTPNPFEFLATYEAALKAKAERLKSANPQSKTEGDQHGNPADRITATSNTRSGIPDASPEELFKQAFPLRQ